MAQLLHIRGARARHVSRRPLVSVALLLGLATCLFLGSLAISWQAAGR